MNYTHKLPAGYIVTDTEAGLDEEVMSREDTAKYLVKRIKELGHRIEKMLGDLDEGRAMILYFPEEYKMLDMEMIDAVAYYAM